MECLFKFVDFMSTFEDSLKKLETLKPDLNIFEGIYPRLDVCKQNNDQANKTTNTQNDTNTFGYSEFEVFFNSFANPKEVLNFFDENSSSSSLPSSSLNSSFSPSTPTVFSLTQNPFTNVKEQSCLKYYNYCMVNANWTLINQQPCPSNHNKTHNFNNNKSILKQDPVLISSLDFCPKPSTQSTALFSSKNTLPTKNSIVTTKYSGIYTTNTQTNDYTIFNTRSKSNTKIETVSTNENTTTSIVINPNNNVTYDGVRSQSNKESYAAFLLLPFIILIMALVLLWRRKKKINLLKKKRMMVQRTESSTTATTIITSFPQTPTSTKDLLDFHINRESKNKSKKNQVQTLRQDSDPSNYTSSGDSINIPKLYSVKDFQQSHELTESTPNHTDKNINDTYSSTVFAKRHISSPNPLHKDLKNGSGVSLVVENLANEWDKRFTSIIDWMNRSEMGLNDSAT